MNDTTPAPAVHAAPPPLGLLTPPTPRPLLSSLFTWLGLSLFVVALFLPGLALADDRYWLPLFTRYVALAIFALSVDLIWGYTGLLSLGQGLYFGLGAYSVGYSLKLRQAALAADLPPVAGPNMALPDFMAYCRLEAVPAWIAPLINIWIALPLAVIVPTVVAALFGWVTFRRGIKGVYFSLITQALLLAVFTLVDDQQAYTGGRVGMVGLAKLELFGIRFVHLQLYFLVAGVLSVCFLLCWLLMQSKVGKILTAIRDSEYRLLALGYNTAAYKTFIFALSGGLAGLAGALYVSALGTAGPDRLSIGFSIEVVIFVAVGGRGTLVGAILGAVLVSFANTWVNDEFKDLWPFFLGGLFIVIVVFLPEGIVGWLRALPGRLRRKLGRAPVAA